VTVTKKKLDQWVYVNLTWEDVNVGDYVIVEVWYGNKLVRRSLYKVRGKKYKDRTYKFITVRLPFYSVIRRASREWAFKKSYNLKLVVKKP